VINHAVAVEVSLPPAGTALTQPVTVYRGGTDCAGTNPDTAADRCTTTLDVNGKGSCALTLTAAGKLNLCAAYPGDVAHAQAVSAPVTQEVRSSNTQVVISKVEPSPVVMGSPAEVYYSVTSPDGTPAGTVTVSGGGATCSASVAAGHCALTPSQPHLQNIAAAFAGGNAGSVVMQPSASDPVVLRVNAPPTEMDLDAKKVEAVLPVGSLVGNLTASDPNPDEDLSFSLATGAGSEGNQYFAVDGDRLTLKSALPLWSSSVSLRLRVTDPVGLTFEQPFKLKVFIDNTTVLPVTGFAAGRTTVLPAQPREQAYDRSADLQLEIPRLGVSADIVGVPASGDGWDTTWLNHEVGWLAGSAFPTWTGNSVLAGHNYLADGKPGPFDRLDSLKFGDELQVHAYGQTYTYEVRQVSQVSPGDLSVLKHEDKAWLTLITCRGFDEDRDTYTYRVVVRAVLKDVH
jgi:LPXTG-site transpeptidase (sortase) family protein